MTIQNLRNIAIIAHVDHGKTTLIDTILRQSGTFRANQDVEDRVMDSNDLEKEQGYHHFGKMHLCFVGRHQDQYHRHSGSRGFWWWSRTNSEHGWTALFFWSMPQRPLCHKPNSFLGKALAQGIRPIVVVNKLTALMRPTEVLNEVFDLFSSLDASEEQLDFPVLYASGRDGWCCDTLRGLAKTCTRCWIWFWHVPTKSRSWWKIQNAGHDPKCRPVSGTYPGWSRCLWLCKKSTCRSKPWT